MSATDHQTAQRSAYGTPEAGPSRSRTLVPLYVRLVPKDIWIRLHIDTNSTIGALKDAVLDKLCMPPTDPALQPAFYEDACAASKGSILPTTASRAFPKTFLAREPKRTLEEVLNADELAKSARSTPLRTPLPSKARKEKEKAAALRRAASNVLRGDPGDGGLGLMGGTEMPSTAAKQNAGPAPSRGKAATLTDKLGLPAREDQQESQTEVRSSGRRDLQRSVGKREELMPKRSPAPEPEDQTLTFGLDAYNDLAFGLLPGNEEAKRSEAAAIASLQGYPSASAANRHQHDVSSSSTVQSSDESSPASASSHTEAGESDEASSEAEASAEEELSHDVHPSSSRSSSSDSVMSLTGDVEHLNCAPASSDEDEDVEGNESDVPAAHERARSNTLRPSPMADSNNADDNTGHAAEQDGPAARTQAVGAPVPSSGSKPGAIDVPVRVGSTRTSRSRTVTQHDHTPFALRPDKEAEIRPSEEGTIVSPAEGPSDVEVSHRLAGIYANEISTWQGARHNLAHCYAVHSYSNGHGLEDWRTIAAFHLRPFELLELQYASPHYKMHLPRSGEAIEARLPPLPSEQGSAPRPNPSLHADYLEPSLEGWCYVYKRGSGPSKAQRAGVGIWKLRWLTVRGSRFVVFRKRPQRSHETEVIGDMWNLESVDAVFSERADGVARPPLPNIVGLSKEMVTVSFRGLYVPPHSIHDEGEQYRKPSISMRFITDLDHHAFFSTFVRARHRYSLRYSDPDLSLLSLEWRRRALARATIAGLGGTIPYGRTSRRSGRNALARKRLRPGGVSREFDDADRWSSASESEDVVPRALSSDFSYAGTTTRPDVSVLPSMPSLFQYNGSNTSKSGREARYSPSTPQQIRKELSNAPAEAAVTSPQRITTTLPPIRVDTTVTTQHNIPPSLQGAPSLASSMLRPGDIVTPERRESLSPASRSSMHSPAASPSNRFPRGSPSMTSITAHDLRRQQRYASAGAVSPDE